MRARRRGLIVGLAVGNAAANNRQQKQGLIIIVFSS